MLDNDKQVTIVGHTDAVGTGPYNQNLSERRAESVRDYLQSQAADPAVQYTSVGKGETSPVARTRLARRWRCWRSMRVMKTVRQVVVFDAADMHAESAFWAGILGGHVFEDDTFHSVIDAAGDWRIGVQLAPDHDPPDWPHGAPQQVHLDLHVEDPRAAHEEAIALGARLLQPAPDFETDEGHQVYADPVGRPFCIGWGHPSQEALTAFVAARLGQGQLDRDA